MRHIFFVGNENYILIRFFVTWKIPLPSLTLRGTYGEIAPSPGPGWHCLPHEHTWEVTHGLDYHAQGELVVMRQLQWPVIQGNEMCLTITAHFRIMEGLKDLSAGKAGGRHGCGVTVSFVLCVHILQKCLEGLFHPNCRKRIPETM